jgi:hypothetical protein
LCGPAVYFLLYKKWIDARHVFAIGLACLAASCRVNAHVTSDWIAHEFLIGQLLQAIGQPMAVISLLFLASSVVQPMEGPLVSGIINMFRAFGTLLGDAMLERVFTLREKIHANVILDSAAGAGMMTPSQHSSALQTLGDLAERISRQNIEKIETALAGLSDPEEIIEAICEWANAHTHEPDMRPLVLDLVRHAKQDAALTKRHTELFSKQWTIVGKLLLRAFPKGRAPATALELGALVMELTYGTAVQFRAGPTGGELVRIALNGLMTAAQMPRKTR